MFSLGGDLDISSASIRERDRAALVAYGESCVRILHRNMNTLGLPMITIGLAQGDALGGGFESLLSFNVIIAERTAKFGFPEDMFGLFPRHGRLQPGGAAHRCGVRRGDDAQRQHLQRRRNEGRRLVHMVVEPGQGVEAAREYMQRTSGATSARAPLPGRSSQSGLA